VSQKPNVYIFVIQEPLARGSMFPSTGSLAESLVAKGLCILARFRIWRERRWLQFLIRIDSKSGDCLQPWYLVLYARKAVELGMTTVTLSEVCERSSEGIADRKSFPRIYKDTGNESNNSNHVVASLPRPWPRVFLHEYPQSPYLWTCCI
jgi:hypothetical protein